MRQLKTFSLLPIIIFISSVLHGLVNAADSGKEQIVSSSTSLNGDDTSINLESAYQSDETPSVPVTVVRNRKNIAPDQRKLLKNTKSTTRLRKSVSFKE